MAILLLLSFSLNESLENSPNALRLPNSVENSEIDVVSSPEDSRFLKSKVLGLDVWVDNDESFQTEMSFFTRIWGEEEFSQGIYIQIGTDVYKDLSSYEESFKKANAAIKDSKISLERYGSLSSHLREKGSKSFGYKLTEKELLGNYATESGKMPKLYDKSYTEIEGFDTLQEFFQSLSSKVLRSEDLYSNQKVDILDHFLSQLPSGPAKQYLMNQFLANHLDEASFYVDSSLVEELSIISKTLKKQKIDLDSPDIKGNPVCEFLREQAVSLSRNCMWEDRIVLDDFVEKLNLIQDTYELDLDRLACDFSSKEKETAKDLRPKEKQKFWQAFKQLAHGLVENGSDNYKDSFQPIVKMAAGYTHAYNSEGEEVWYKLESKNSSRTLNERQMPANRKSLNANAQEKSTNNEPETTAQSSVYGFESWVSSEISNPDKCSPRRLANAIRDIKSMVNKEAGSKALEDTKEVYRISGKGSEGDSVDLKVTLDVHSIESECKNKNLKVLLRNVLKDLGPSRSFNDSHAFYSGQKKADGESRCNYGVVLDGSIHRMNENTLDSTVLHKIGLGIR